MANPVIEQYLRYLPKEVRDALDIEIEYSDGELRTRVRHESITPSEYGSRAPGTQPDPVAYGTVFALEFTPTSDTAYRVFKIPAHFVSDASFHIHWTKSDAGTDESGRNVRWRISYTVFDGLSDDIDVVPTVLEAEDTYEDAGTGTSRIIYRTGNLDAPGFIPNYYVGVCIEAITPVGTALVNEPALVSMDLVWLENINI